MLRPNGFRILCISFANLLAGIAEAAFLVISTGIALGVTTSDSSLEIFSRFDMEITTSLWLAGAFIFAKFTLGTIALWLQSGLTESVVVHQRLKITELYFGSTWEAQQDAPTGHLQHLLLGFSQEISGLLNSFNQGLSSMLSLMALIGVALFVDPFSTLIAGFALLILGIALSPIRKAIAQRSKRTASSQLDFAHGIAEYSSLGIAIQSYGVSEPVKQNLGRLLKVEGKARRKMEFTLQTITPVYIASAYIFILIALSIVSRNETMSLDKIGPVALLMLRGLTYGQSVYFFLAMKRAMTGTFEQLNSTMDFYSKNKLRTGREEVTGFNSLTFDGVTFSHKNGTEIIKNASFRMKHGEILGLSGESGSGKTTILELICGLRSPDHGCILINETNLELINLNSWQKNYSLVTQEPRLISGSATDNIKFFRNNISIEDIEKAAQDALYLSDSSTHLNNLEMHQIGEAGSQLSGGQKQRLSLARALASNPPLLLLDEPTASLDIESEEKICETLNNLRGKVSILIVSHSENVLKICDRVIYLEGNSIISTDSSSKIES